MGVQPLQGRLGRAAQCRRGTAVGMRGTETVRAPLDQEELRAFAGRFHEPMRFFHVYGLIRIAMNDQPGDGQTSRCFQEVESIPVVDKVIPVRRSYWHL